MSAFYVGQRVRVARVLDPRDFPGVRVGDEGVVSGVDTCPSGPALYGLNIAPLWEDKDYVYGWAAEELEPITPPGLESLDEINALYEPEPCTADVDSRGFHVPESIAIRGRRL